MSNRIDANQIKAELDRAIPDADNQAILSQSTLDPYLTRSGI
jgi:hypothetical protein